MPCRPQHDSLVAPFWLTHTQSRTDHVRPNKSSFIAAEKATEQHTEIETLHELAVESRDNIERGTEQLRQAEERERGGTQITVVFTLTLAFALLFLDWFY